jgi:hypothetical protein
MRWPDISFAINKTCQLLATPMEAHCSAVKRILRYVRGTISASILRSSSTELSVYMDADWAGVQMIGGQLAATPCTMDPAWSHGVQGSSQQWAGPASTEAEYKAIANGTAELTWMQYVLIELDADSVHLGTLWFFFCNFEFQRGSKFISGIGMHGPYISEKFQYRNRSILGCRKKILTVYRTKILFFTNLSFLYFPKYMVFYNRNFWRTYLTNISRYVYFAQVFWDSER